MIKSPITIDQISRTNVKFNGLSLVRLDDNCTREAARVAMYNGMTAILQKNGNIGMSRTGIFDRPQSLRAQERVAFMLYNLKMVSREFWEAALKRRDVDEINMDMVTLRNDAERLGQASRQLQLQA